MPTNLMPPSTTIDSPFPQLTVALWTPQGRGAVATIKVRGPIDSPFQNPPHHIPFRAANGRTLADQPLNRIVFGHWGTEPAEDVVVCRISPTELEIHCHGGMAAARRIMADWQSLGVAVVDWTAQSEIEAGTFATICASAITRASTVRVATILLDQQAAWQNLASDAFRLAQSSDWNSLAWIRLRDKVTQALTWTQLGRHLGEPFQVVLTGPPNVGKSALLNTLVGYQRSVVFDQPGTTRDVVTAETAFDGWPVRLIDTAGLRENATGLEAEGIELAREQLTTADLILQVTTATEIQSQQSAPTHAHPGTIRIANKIDLLSDKISFAGKHPQFVAVSAHTGEGVEELIARIAQTLVPSPPAPGEAIPFREELVQWLHALRSAIDQQSLSAIESLAPHIVRGDATGLVNTPGSAWG